MITYQIVGFQKIVKKKDGKELYVLHTVYREERSGMFGVAVEKIFASPSLITGGAVAVDKKCNVIYDRNGYVQEVVLLTTRRISRIIQNR